MNLSARLRQAARELDYDDPDYKILAVLLHEAADANDRTTPGSEPPRNELHLVVQYHSPDANYAATLLRDGEPWYLEGGLVGLGWTRGQAVDDLIEIATYLVVHGDNALCEAPVPLEDRVWLFQRLDHGVTDDAMYAALRDAGWPGYTMRT